MTLARVISARRWMTWAIGIRSAHRDRTKNRVKYPWIGLELRPLLAGVAIVLASAVVVMPHAAQAQFVCAGSPTGSTPQTGAGANAAGSTANVACGANAEAIGNGAGTAVGSGANATGTFSSNTALGNAANASGVTSDNTALGAQANAAGPAGSGPTNNTAVGFRANSSGLGNSTAVGSFADADGTNSNNVALGYQSNSGGDGSSNVAIGANANASGTGTNSVAIGSGTSANFQNSAAYGSGATATRANQQVFGTASNTYTLSGISSAASRAAQSGPTQIVTSDSGGNLATSTIAGLGLASTGDVANMGSQINAINSQISAINSRLDNLTIESRAGTALAMAGTGLHFDSRPGKASIAVAVGNYKGVSGLAVGFGYAVTDRFRVNASVSGASTVNEYGGVVGASFTLN